MEGSIDNGERKKTHKPARRNAYIKKGKVTDSGESDSEEANGRQEKSPGQKEINQEKQEKESVSGKLLKETRGIEDNKI